MDRNGAFTLAGTRVAVDIGSTVVKLAHVAADRTLVGQAFHPRDFAAGIAAQVEALLALEAPGRDDVLVCSSANGGLRVGIVCLTGLYSGARVRDQVLLAGANPVFVHALGDEAGRDDAVDLLLVCGGIDCGDAGPLAQRLEAFGPEGYRFGALLYAGNRHLAPRFLQRFPAARVVANPLAQGLAGPAPTVFEAVRRAYLDDLVHKEGLRDLRPALARGIRPTPEVVNLGFQRAVADGGDIAIAGPCVLADIGGATTDFHYTVEILREESPESAPVGCSVARYVFTDLGIAASRDTALLQLRNHPRLYDFLAALRPGEVEEAYRGLREGEQEADGRLLAYACLFLGLDRFAQGRGPGLPSADLGKLSQLLLTGGAAQGMEETVAARVAALAMPPQAPAPLVHIDRHYRIWVDGITWAGRAPE